MKDSIKKTEMENPFYGNEKKDLVEKEENAKKKHFNSLEKKSRNIYTH